ncbi:PAS domain-containing protein [Rhizobium sp. S152]|uniref:PAS domain-containing protein n=1 Tax=Rhizobium sp. S152 TaxID=3055038 RepID=UPI0025A9F88C|nr:PAS domain-containing protein [Rhizobium sp. S152]MDM9625578.1 PAS domain-containing protein [Rhizobium sp. S152]
MNFGVSEEEPGIWTWCLEKNVFYADTALARLLGLDPDEALCGLSIEHYIASIHPLDRKRVAHSISEAVADGGPYFDEYRVEDCFGEIRKVMALGRCFRDRTGNPVHYAGITYPLPPF